MTDEIFNLMECFPGSYINRFGEIILSEKGNVYFTAKNCTDKEILSASYLNGVQGQWQKESRTVHAKGIMNGENN